MSTTDRRSRAALVALALAFSAAFLGLVGRLVYIQVTSAETLSRLADRQHARRHDLAPCRGAIVDTRGRPMASTVESYSLFADPRLIYDESYASWRVDDPAAGASPAAVLIGRAAKIDPETIERTITAHADRHFVWLKRRIDRAQRDAIAAHRIPGIGFHTESRRHYPVGSLAAHVLGAVGSESQGVAGVEYLLDGRLRGSQGRRVVQVDGRRRPVWTRPADFAPAADGQLLVMTIDLTVQMFAEEALSEACTEFSAKGGSAVVMDPMTGEVLAMANWPRVEPGNYLEVDPYARRNRVLTDPYEPGSTFKCFIAAAALDAGTVRAGETIFCHNGVYRIGRRTLRDVHGYGELPFEDVVIKSSNIGMGIIGTRMGRDALHEAMRRFGFGRKTGVLLPGEHPGVVYPLSRWSTLSVTSVPMGYEVMVTPLQVVTAFSAIANGGVLLAPRVISRAYYPDGTVAADLSEPIVVRRVLRRQTADFMRTRVLRGVVERGTGRRAAIEGYRVFGKTGTAKKPDPAGGYSDTLYMSSFIGAAPLEEPRVVVMVVIDEPDRSKAYYGGTVAAPAVRRILESTLAYLHVPPDEPARATRTVVQPAF